MVSSSASIWAVSVDESDAFVIIETVGYKVHWGKQTARMGYVEAFIANGADSVMVKGDRTFFHASDYDGGWKHWGQLIDWEIVEEVPGKAVVKYESKDAGSKEYTCVASYYDSVNYIKHEFTVTNAGPDPVMSFEGGHEPMFEPNRDFEGMKTFDQPFSHAAFWVKEGTFAAIYGPDAQESQVSVWENRNPGRIALVHDNMGEQLKKGESATITYYVVFGKGDDKDATALAEDVTKEPPIGGTVSPVGALATMWGRIRAKGF